MDERFKSALSQFHRDQRKEAFKELPEDALSKMTPKELAEWHARNPEDSAQHILATHEWNRRLIVEQVRWMKFAVWAAVISAIVGAIVGAAVTYALPKMFDQQKEQRASGSTNAQPDNSALDKQPRPPVNPAPVTKKAP